MKATVWSLILQQKEQGKILSQTETHPCLCPFITPLTHSLTCGGSLGYQTLARPPPGAATCTAHIQNWASMFSCTPTVGLSTCRCCQNKGAKRGHEPIPPPPRCLAFGEWLQEGVGQPCQMYRPHWSPSAHQLSPPHAF